MRIFDDRVYRRDCASWRVLAILDQHVAGVCRQRAVHSVLESMSYFMRSWRWSVGVPGRVYHVACDDVCVTLFPGAAGYACHTALMAGWERNEMSREYEYRDTNAGDGWAPHRKGCRCLECENERLRDENKRLKQIVAEPEAEKAKQQ